jgi:CheY-like chemotaxis protein
MAPQTSWRVLVVDDDVSVVDAVVRLLRRDGYTVETAENGQHALALLSASTYDLLLCDLRMPELDGPSFYDRLLLQYPAVCQRVIFFTGDTLHTENRAFLEQSGQPWLPKPCTAATLRSALAQFLRMLKPDDELPLSPAQ